MRVKSYYAVSIEAAIGQAGQELGPDAVLITSRRTGADTRHLGDYEVVFGLAREAETRLENNLPLNQVDQADMEVIRRELTAATRALSAAWRKSSSSPSSPEIAQAEAMLSAADVAQELIDDLVAVVEESLREQTTYAQARLGTRETRARLRAVSPTLGESEARVARMLREQFEGLVRVDAGLEAPKSARRIVAVVGPPGAGKTATIVKLAIVHGLQTRRPSMIVSTDSYRVAATEQIRSYAATIGMAFQTADSASGLGQILEEQRSKELILIDTPGFSPSDIDASQEMARFMGMHPDIEVHLVLPATMRFVDLAATAQRFAPFNPTKIIATRFDETKCYGALVSYAALANVPFSFICDGQQIPDDIEAATIDRLLSFLPEDKPRVAVSAA